MPRPAKTIPERRATSALIDFLRDQADLDDLARVYSYLLSDDPIRIVDAVGESDTFQDGKRRPTPDR